MAQTTWKQVVYDVADAYREANGTSDKIPVGQIADKVRAGAGTPYEGDNPLTIGQAGFTFPAKTLLKDGLQIINGVNGEDLTDTVADQTTAVEALMKMVSRKIAMNNGEGQYVWTKRSGKRIALTQTTNNVNPTILQVTSDTTDLSKVDASWFVGFKSTYLANNTSYPWEIISSTKIKVNTTETTFTYNPATAQLSIAMNLSGGRTWNGYEENITESYVVSSDELAYPIDGELDGFWYVRNRGIDFGSVILTATSTSITVEHGLGITPAHVVIYSATDIAAVSGFTSANIDGYAIEYAGVSGKFNQSKVGTTRNASSVTFKSFNSTYPFKTGEYRWAVFVA